MRLFFQLRTQEIGNVNDVLHLSFCAKRLENKVSRLNLLFPCYTSFIEVLFMCRSLAK